MIVLVIIQLSIFQFLIH